MDVFKAPPAFAPSQRPQTTSQPDQRPMAGPVKTTRALTSRAHPYHRPSQVPSDERIMTRRMKRFDSINPRDVFPDAYNIPQRDANDWLGQVQARHGLSAAFRSLFDLNIHSGHIAGWDSKLDHFTYRQRRKSYCPGAMINYLRSEYSRNYMKPMGKSAPRGALCRICKEHVANAKNPANARLRSMDLTLEYNNYFVHPAQFPYGQGHLLLIQQEHRPMHHDYSSLKDHLLLLDQAPEYAVCQNSHILGGGATIPQHHHVPLIHKADLPIMQAQIKPETLQSKDGVDYALLDYPFTTFSLSSAEGDKLALAAEAIIDHWKTSDPHHDSGEKKRTANYILCKEGERYRILIFLRDVSCLPGQEFQQIKSEFCGFIELGGKLLLAEKKDPQENRQMKTRLNDRRFMARVIDQGLMELDPQQREGVLDGQARLKGMLARPR